ncbi:MAG: selenoneine synthase SenA [Betaproteobacteria bacterium]
MSADPSILARELCSSRERTDRLARELAGERLLGAQLPIVNPPLWEIGHLAWFQEFWCLRQKVDGAIADSILTGADRLYDSARVAHATRWSLPLPSFEATRAYQREVLERVVRRLQQEPANSRLHYFADLAAFHEDMHGEAFHYTRQTLGYPDPFDPPGAPVASSDSCGAKSPGTPAAGDAEFGGGRFMLGAAPGGGFVFDNEKWAHGVTVAPFRMARTAVTNAGYAAFVAGGGYSRREFWDDAGWAWLAQAGLKAPRYWIGDDTALAVGPWRVRRFDRSVPLDPDHPVVHVNWHEAQAYCRFAARRLPTEAEWEYAARAGDAGTRPFPWGDAVPDAGRANLQAGGTLPVDALEAGDAPGGCRQLIGNVWEWTASTFAPYPGYMVDPYKEYSEPWFGTHKVLRGGSFATPRRLIRATWRNFYTPDRGDMFAGFRTCALD